MFCFIPSLLIFNKMRSVFVLVCVTFLLLDVIGICNGDKLRMNFYHKTCPQVARVVRVMTWNRVRANPSLAAKLLRLHYHDCFVRGCDGSILLNSTSKSTLAEKEARPNLSLDGYDVIDAIKERIERLCPGTVSCADIVALVARDAVSFQFKRSMWRVKTGRRDGKISLASEVNGNLPSASSNFTTLQENFASKGLDVVDLVALSGAHTIGVAHCGVISRRLFNFTGKGDTDPSLDQTYANFLKTKCSGSPNPSPVLEMDPGGRPEFFDSHYYRNVEQNKGLFQSDAALLTDPNSARIANQLQNGFLFFRQFAQSMMNMGEVEVLTGDDSGEIRMTCSVVNS